MIWIFFGLIVVALVVVPSFLVKRTLRKYSVEYRDLPGTGGELARHLAKEFNLPITIEQTEKGDHYDPSDRTVRLSPEFYNGRSLSAVAVAAHEVGHAIQHNTDYKPLKWRSRLVKLAQFAERFGGILFIAAPILGLLMRSPVGAGAVWLLAASNILLAVLVHLVTLPVEWDASFRRALPILQNGEYLVGSELKAARKVLLAAVFTYISGALLSLVNVWRWLAVFRRM